MIRSERLLSQLMLMEGLRLEAYKDAAGVWTIGYGHTQDVRPGDKISEYCAKEYLLQDLYPVEQAVNKLNIARTEGQFDALVSFAFNLGIDRLKKSTLLKVICGGGSKNQIKRGWNADANGKQEDSSSKSRIRELENFYFEHGLNG